MSGENESRGLILTEGLMLEMAKMPEKMRTMLLLLGEMADEMGKLRRQVQLLTKVTPRQAKMINEAIRERGSQVAALHSIAWEGAPKEFASAIRREVRNRFGVSSSKEIPQCEYDVVMKMIGMWDDYLLAMKMRREKEL